MTGVQQLKTADWGPGKAILKREHKPGLDRERSQSQNAHTRVGMRQKALK